VARRGSTKALSVLHEERVAKAYRGKRSPSSGGAATDRGDVRNDSHLYECKHAGTYDKPARSVSVRLADLEKIFDEAQSEGKDWAACLSIYAPDSVLADRGGFVDLTVRPMAADVERGYDGTWGEYRG
jgi:hypothetical protein